MKETFNQRYKQVYQLAEQQGEAFAEAENDYVNQLNMIKKLSNDQCSAKDKMKKCVIAKSNIDKILKQHPPNSYSKIQISRIR